MTRMTNVSRFPRSATCSQTATTALMSTTAVCSEFFLGSISTAHTEIYTNCETQFNPHTSASRSCCTNEFRGHSFEVDFTCSPCRYMSTDPHQRQHDSDQSASRRHRASLQVAAEHLRQRRPTLLRQSGKSLRRVHLFRHRPLGRREDVPEHRRNRVFEHYQHHDFA